MTLWILLSTIYPNGRGVVNHEFETDSGLRYISRVVETGINTSRVKGCAWTSEAGLNHRVILGIEYICNGVTDGSIDVVRTECQRVVWPDLNCMSYGRDRIWV